MSTVHPDCAQSERAWIRRLRAGFVGFHVLAVTLLSLPAPPADARQDSTWQQPHVRAQVLAWAAPFRPLLAAHDDEAVLRLARDAADAALDVREVLVAPFTPYARAVGMKQGWQMFTSIIDAPARLRIRVRRGSADGWEPLYLARDPALAWRRAQLDDYRIRRLTSEWSWGGNRDSYRRFTRTLAAWVVADDPSVRRVEVAMLRARLPTPAELAAGARPAEEAIWVEELDAARAR